MITCELQLATNAPRRNRRFVYNHFYASWASLSCNWTIIPIQNHGHRMSKRDLDDHERHSSHQQGIPRSLPLVSYVRTRRNLTWRFNSTNFPWAQQIMRYACQHLIFLKYKPSSHLACLISLRKTSSLSITSSLLHWMWDEEIGLNFVVRQKVPLPCRSSSSQLSPYNNSDIAH